MNLTLAIIILLNFFSCSVFISKKSHSLIVYSKELKRISNIRISGLSDSNDKKVKILIDDLKSLLKRKGSNPFITFLKKQEVILDYNSFNCRVDQISCVFSNISDRIFITDKFFGLKRHERLSTIFHELYHLYYEAPHGDCPSNKWNFNDCDETLESAYGIEVKYYDWLLTFGEDEEISKSLNIAKQHILFKKKE